jgi:DNA helicase II / ATP-dependent DNA helicase PcrA
MNAMIWTEQQERIFDFVANGAGNAVVEAYAGTGKTTTIVEAVNRVPRGKRVLFVAFNKSIAQELQRRLPGADAMTLHSLGLKAVTRATGRRAIDGDALKKVIRELLPEHSYDDRNALAKLVGACKTALTDDAAGVLRGLDIDFSELDEDTAIDYARRLLAAQAKHGTSAIDFDDMIWLPAINGWNVGAYDFVFVDETQDLSPGQLVLVQRAAGKRGRIVAIGDRRQSIYGFRGADAEAIPRMITELEAAVLPLSITYRCPRLVVAEANAHVPDFVAADTAPEGVVRNATHVELITNATDGDFVLSRTNAPLVSLCYRWLAAGRKCTIRGRDIGASLTAWFKRYASGKTALDALDAVSKWERIEVAKAEKDERDAQPAIDKAECLRALLDDCETVADAVAKCDRMFADNTVGGIVLSSTHRAKGLEADRVWVLRDTYCRARRDRNGEVIPVSEEEKNLLYVAQTRAKRELVYCPSRNE